MAVYKSPRGKWKVDVTINGQRVRTDFATKSGADEFHRSLLIRKKMGAVESHPTHRKTIKESMRWYYATISSTKESYKEEKFFFSLLFECLGSREVLGLSKKDDDLEYIDQVKFEHLRSVQTYLVTSKTHGKCRSKRISGVRNDEERAREIEQIYSLVDLPEPCSQNPESCSAMTLSPSRVNRLFNTWKHFFNECDRNGWITKNPAHHLKALKENPKTKKVHDDVTVQRIIHKAFELAESVNPTTGKSTEYFFEIGQILWFLAKTGARPIEVKRLTWDDVDFADGSISLKSLKGGLRVRSIPLTMELKEFLSERRSQRLKFRDNLVFHSATGIEFNIDAFGRAVSRICSLLGIEDFTSYCLRHGFVTRARRVGLSVGDAGDLAGHSNYNTTKKIYSHLVSEDLRPAMSQIGAALKIVRTVGE